jgi:hypothetical protein
MSSLTNIEKRKFEDLLGMGSGYVLDFSNRTFQEFILDSAGRDVYDKHYDHGSGSKANRLRGFWQYEGNGVVGKLMEEMLDRGVERGQFTGKDALLDACRRIVAHLRQDSPVPELDALAAISDERDFETVAKAIREAIEKNEPESGLDRLHTFVIKYVRTLCTRHGLSFTRDKPLHSLFGEYVKCLRDGGHIESEMALRILKSSISTLEAFNDVRNNRSLAHDNPVLHYDEALLIFNHIASSIRFLRGLEARIKPQGHAEQFPAIDTSDDIPF